jgi:UPF0271 protein
VSVVLEPFGDTAWRFRLPESADGRAVLESLRGVPGVIDAVVCERHALVTFDPVAPLAGIADAIDASMVCLARASAPREHVVGVRYDGPDLDDVARAAGLSRDEVAVRHASGRYAVASIGFLPGFAYLRGLDPGLVLPRRASPRARVPSRSVGIGGPYTGVYPFASPGGWNLIGTAPDFTPFDPGSGAALALGDIVRFVVVSP